MVPDAIVNRGVPVSEKSLVIAIVMQWCSVAHARAVPVASRKSPESLVVTSAWLVNGSLPTVAWRVLCALYAKLNRNLNPPHASCVMS